jgi:hypothetical protein
VRGTGSGAAMKPGAVIVRGGRSGAAATVAVGGNDLNGGHCGKRSGAVVAAAAVGGGDDDGDSSELHYDGARVRRTLCCTASMQRPMQPQTFQGGPRRRTYRAGKTRCQAS